MDTASAWLRRARKNRFLTNGVPFLIIIIGGSFVLEKFAKVRYDLKRGTYITKEEAESAGITLRNGKIDIEAVYESMKGQDLDEWTNIRGPRPWEDSKTVQESQRQGKT